MEPHLLHISVIFEPPERFQITALTTIPRTTVENVTLLAFLSFCGSSVPSRDLPRLEVYQVESSFR